MFFIIPLPAVVIFAILAWYSKEIGNYAHAAIYQPIATGLLVITALLSFFSKKMRKPYTIWITLGLLFSLGGDSAIIDPADQGRLIIGLLFFLVAHVVYAAGFTVLSGFKKQDIWTGVIMGSIFTVLMVLIWPGLGDMMIPVTVYAFAITFMVWRAVSTLFGTYFNKVQALIISCGSILFFIADSILALHLFRSSAVSLTPGLLLYFSGQILLAISPSMFALDKKSE